MADLADEGILLAYGLSVSELHRRSAYYVKRILAGANPGDLPVENVPAHLLAEADEVIE